MILNNLFESRYGAAAGVETIRQLVHAVKNSADTDLKVGPEMFPVSYGDARYLLQYWKANREGGDATAEYFGDANWIEAKLAKRDHTMSPDRLKDMDQERMKSKEYDRMVGIEEYDTRPRDKEDKEAKLKALQALLVDPTTAKDPQMKQAIQSRLAQLNASFIDPHEKNIPSPTSDNPVTTRVEEDDESPRKMYHKHFVKAMKAMPGSQVQKRHQLEMEKYKKMMGKSFIDQVAPKEFAKFDRKVEEGHPADYKGWKYDIEYIEDEDTRKKLHSATKDGKRVSIDWSPYSTLTDDDYKLWIDLGMPDRSTVDSIGPIDHDDLITVAKTKQGTADLLTRELNELKRLSGVPKTDDVAGKLDAKTRIELQKAKQKYAGLAKGDPLASMLMNLGKDIDRLDQENDVEDAEIAAQAIVDKMHTDSINKLKKLK